MGLGNTFDNVDKNIDDMPRQREEKLKRIRKAKPVVVYQNSIGSQRFTSVEAAREYLEEIIPNEFSVYINEENDDESDESDNEISYNIEVSIKLVERITV